MGKYIVCLRLILCFAIGHGLIVDITKDIMVKPTPYLFLNPTDIVNVTMNCIGSSNSVQYYVSNKMRWTFIANSGKEHVLSDSFYLTKDALNYLDARLSLTYDIYKKGFKFGITIKGVRRIDNGIYRCSLVGWNNEVIDSKDVKLTVVSPIQSMHIELFDANNSLVSASSSPKSQLFKIAPGQYIVKCQANGSNPEPMMALFLNDRNLNVSTESKEDNSSEFKSFTGNLKLYSLAIDADIAPQDVVCKANIPGDFYQFRKVGLYMMVEIVNPTFACENISAAVGDRYINLKCNVSDHGNKEDLVCDNIRWLLGKKGQLIKYAERWEDQSKEYDNLESYCMETNQQLEVMLEIYTVNANIFQENFIIVYLKGENSFIHPVKLHDITSAEANVVTLLPVIFYLALAGISKQLSM